MIIDCILDRLDDEVRGDYRYTRVQFLEDAVAYEWYDLAHYLNVKNEHMVKQLLYYYLVGEYNLAIAYYIHNRQWCKDDTPFTIAEYQDKDKEMFTMCGNDCKDWKEFIDKHRL